jgi:hypothetical protein
MKKVVLSVSAQTWKMENPWWIPNFYGIVDVVSLYILRVGMNG